MNDKFIVAENEKLIKYRMKVLVDITVKKCVKCANSIDYNEDYCKSKCSTHNAIISLQDGIQNLLKINNELRRKNEQETK